jgi:hypothetical protein
MIQSTLDPLFINDIVRNPTNQHRKKQVIALRALKQIFQLEKPEKISSSKSLISKIRN